MNDLQKELARLEAREGWLLEVLAANKEYDNPFPEPWTLASLCLEHERVFKCINDVRGQLYCPDCED